MSIIKNNRSKKLRWVMNAMLSIFMILVMSFIFCATTIKTVSAEESVIGSAVCTARTRMNLRSGPSSKSSKVGTLPGKTIVNVYQISNNWYKISYNGKTVWAHGSYLRYTPNGNIASETQNVAAETVTATTPAQDTQPAVQKNFAIFYQGDSRWGFSSSVAKKACLLTGHAIVLNNLGLDVTPRTVYKSNSNTTSICLSRIEGAFGIDAVSALNSDSGYFASFDGYRTYIKSPSQNYEAAVKEAIANHPEGVILYFSKGSRNHAIVACKVEGNTIYYSDPGRNRNSLLTFNNTWVSYHHKMKYGNLSYMIAFDIKQ